MADPPLGFRTWSAKGQGRSPGSTIEQWTLPRFVVCRSAHWPPRMPGWPWVYGPRLPDTLTLIAAWGFQTDSDLFSWLKTTRDGRPRMGTGHTTRKTNEQVLLAIKGAGLRRVSRSVPQAILAPRMEHSAKPEAVMLALEELFGPVRRLELFARRYREGWTSWGNQLPCRAVSDEELATDCPDPTARRRSTNPNQRRSS